MRGAFVHGALRALEDCGVRADVYAGVSSSAPLAAQAAVGRVARHGAEYWNQGGLILDHGDGMSEVVDRGLALILPLVTDWLFERGAPRLIIPACRVRTSSGEALVRGEILAALGRELLLQSARGDRSWVDEHLELEIFDSQTPDASRRIRPENLADVIHASTRMPHAGRRPACIGGHAYLDGALLCAVPVYEAAALGVSTILAIVTEPGPVYRDLFRQEAIPEAMDRFDLRIIRPASDLSEFGVDVMRGTMEGFDAALRHGEAQAESFLRTLEPVTFERRPRRDE
jgi:predicted acylesterase/phospholipase RssA